MIIPWQTLYGTDDMEDMRDMIAPIYRLINKLEDAKTFYYQKKFYAGKDYWRLYAVHPHDIRDDGVIAEINKAQAHWRRILEMVTHQRKEDD